MFIGLISDLVFAVDFRLCGCMLVYLIAGWFGCDLFCLWDCCGLLFVFPVCLVFCLIGLCLDCAFP